MAGESDPPSASSTANDSALGTINSPIFINNKGAKEEIHESMDRIITTTDASNDNKKNGAKEEVVAKNANNDDASNSLPGTETMNNDSVNNMVASNDCDTGSDHPPPSATLEISCSSESTLVMAVSANIINSADVDGHQQQPNHAREEREGGATNGEIPNAKTSSSDDSSNTIICSDAIPMTSPAVAVQTSPIVSDTAASVSDPNVIINSSDNSSSSSGSSSNQNNILMTGMNTERDFQINEILNHRRQLLTWVRTCRKQTQIVYEEMIRSRRVKEESGEQNQQQRCRRGLISKLSSSATLQEGEDLNTNASQMRLGGEGVIESLAKIEIDAYQAITSMNNRNPNSLKRSRPSSSLSLNENSNQRDLRRGSSVGKSHDATASTLSTTSPGGGGGGGDGFRGPSTVHASPSLSTLSQVVKAQTSLSNIHHSQGNQFHKFQPPHGGVLAAKSMPPNHNISASIAASTNNTEKKKKSRKRKANNINSNINNFTNHDRMSSTLPPPSGGPQSNPALTKGGMIMAFPNNNSMPTQVLVPSAAAVNLLGIRHGLLAKLDRLLSLQKSKKQRCVGPNHVNEANTLHIDVDQNDDEQVNFKMHNATPTEIESKSANARDEDSSIPSVIGEHKPSPSGGPLVSIVKEKFGTGPPNHSPLSEVVLWQPNELHKPPLRLPIRRKTQWDCVLEEMKWMSADFHEERKWKIAVGQTLSDSVRKYKSKKKISTSSLIGMTPTKLSQISRSGSNVSSSSRSRTMSINSFSLHASGSCVASNECDYVEPLYVDASIKDVETVKIISRLLSLGILDYWDSNSTTKHHDDMSARQQRIHRLVELESLGTDTVELVKSMESNSHEQIGETSTKSRDDESLQSSNSIGAIRELRFDEITSRIDSSLRLVNTLNNQAFKQSSNMNPFSTNMGVELDERQLDTVRLVERLWSSTNGAKVEEGSHTTQSTAFNHDACCSISAIVGGSFGVGKTVAVCALLWRNRINGPQMIVCSPGSVIRWIHELKKFNDLSSRIYSKSDSREECSYEASDVVVCDYGSLCDFVDTELSNANFAAMFLDIRHYGSAPSKGSYPTGAETQNFPMIILCPLDSVKWWVCVNNFIAKCPTSLKRLVIEQSDHCRNRFVVPIIENGSLGIKEGLNKRAQKLLAMKLAFVFHPSTFVSERGSVGKRVISWAKFQAKKKTKPSVTYYSGKGKGALAPGGWSSILTSTLQNMIYSLLDAILANREDGVGIKNCSTFFSWELHLCPLGKSQKVAYDKSFANMRFGSDETIAHGLLDLRKVCIHSTLRNFTVSSVTPLRRHEVGMHRDGSSILIRSATHSESNVEIAKKIMKKSAKMKELLRVLVTEGGYNVANGSALFESLMLDGGDDPISAKKDKAKKAKVLILATLVEAQLLASFFLSAVGLHHEVLVSSEIEQHSSPLLTSNPRSSILPLHKSSSGGYSWAWCQDLLSRFNETCTERSVDILISSPITISSLSCGIGVANANMVISIDEDWSGREALHIKSIFAKIHWCQLRAPAMAASLSEKVSCKFIKLVCRNTCENTFLCDWDTQKKIDTQKKCNMGTRRSSRQSARASKLNQHAHVACLENEGRRKKHTGLCPIHVVPDAALVDLSGFIIPPGNGGNEETQTIQMNQHFVGANVLRYRNSKLSTVFFVSNAGSDMMFLPTKKNLDHSTMLNSESTFSWALFNVEDHAFLHVIAPTENYLPGFGFGIQPITSSLTAAFHINGSSVRLYVESFKRSSSFIPRKRALESIHLRDEKVATGEGMASSRDSTSTFASSTDLCRKPHAFGENNSDLLVYRLPNDVSRKRKISAVEFEPRGEESDLNVFPFCYSVFNASSSALHIDGNDGGEPLVYFPSFFRYVLQERQKLVCSYPLSAQGETHTASPLKIRVGLPESTSSEFTFTIETNPHAFSDYQLTAENEDLSFHRRLLAADIPNSISYQCTPSLNSIILISEKKRSHHSNTSFTRFDFAGHVLSDSSRKSSDWESKKHKKIRQQSSCNSSSAPDKGLSYFQSERWIDRLSSARGSFTTSNMGRVRLNCRLNDLISNCFSQSCVKVSMTQSNTTCHQIKLNGSIPIRQNIRPALLGAIPLSNEDLLSRKNEYRSGISLPLGIQLPSMEMTLPSSQGEFSEPWTRRDDSILNGCVSRYGMNWQLAAYAVSSGMSCSPGALERSEDNFRKVTRRSAMQCQNRWGSLKSYTSSMLTGLSEKNNDGFQAAIVREAPLFVTKLEGMQRESIIFDRSRPNTRLQQLPDPNGAMILSGQPNPVNESQIDEEKGFPHLLLARVQKLKDASSKRIVINVPLPTSVPTHPSHTEAIQAARASMLSATNVAAPPRHEMWPLELLDFRKQHNSESKVPPQPAPASSRSQPHTIHSTQPQMVYHEAGQFPPPHHQPAPHHVSNAVHKASQPNTQRRSH